jgi:hypothetical protein
MYKKLILVSCIIFTCAFLFSFDWGIKYGAGVSATYGKDAACNIQYDFTNVQNDTIFTDFGYLKLKSNHRMLGLAQNAGMFFAFTLAKGTNEFILQPEVNWQRYNYSNRFEKILPVSDNNLTLAGEFRDSLNGFVRSTLDYVNVPILFKLQQYRQPEDDENNSIVSSFGYIGPSVSFLFNNKVVNVDGIKDLDIQVRQFVDNSVTDADTTQYYTYSKPKNSVDKVLSVRYDVVFGFGWNLTNVFKLGCKKDDFVLDARFNLNLNELGDAELANNYKLLSGILSLGYKF